MSGDERCPEDGCDKPVYAKRLCYGHYQGARLRGALPDSVVDHLPCEFCGHQMVGRQRSRARFCSTKCKERARSAAKAERRVATQQARRCAQCGDPMPASASSRALTCSKPCSVKRSNDARAAAAHQRKLARRAKLGIVCTRCGGPIPDHKPANASLCSETCRRESSHSRWYDPERGRAYNLMYHYGLTAETYDALLDRQDGSCAICGTTEWGGRSGLPHVDHCHETGRVRGLLCRGCNNGLGHFGDDVDRLHAAATYLMQNA